MSNFDNEEVLIVEVPHQGNPIAYFIDRQDFTIAVVANNDIDFTSYDPTSDCTYEAPELTFEDAVDYVQSDLSSMHVLSSREEAKTFLENFRGHGSVSASCAVEKMLGISETCEDVLGTPVEGENHTYIGYSAGLAFYEHGEEGDEYPTLLFWKGQYYDSGFWEVPDFDEADSLKKELN